jgi:hypothetical protein
MILKKSNEINPLKPWISDLTFNVKLKVLTKDVNEMSLL